MTQPVRPVDIVLHQRSKLLELAFDDGSRVQLPFELLRVCSPSAEVQGHGPGQETVQTGKREVGIVSLEPVGHYALKPTFSDGHDTGLFTWDYLHALGADPQRFWSQYEQSLRAANLDRDAVMPGPKGSACASH